MPEQKKGHYRVDAIRRSGTYRGDEHETYEVAWTAASGLTHKEAKRLQMALYDKYGLDGPYFFWPVKETGRKEADH